MQPTVVYPRPSHRVRAWFDFPLAGRGSVGAALESSHPARAPGPKATRTAAVESKANTGPKGLYALVGGACEPGGDPSTTVIRIVPASVPAIGIRVLDPEDFPGIEFGGVPDEYLAAVRDGAAAATGALGGCVISICFVGTSTVDSCNASFFQTARALVGLFAERNWPPDHGALACEFAGFPS